MALRQSLAGANCFKVLCPIPFQSQTTRYLKFQKICNEKKIKLYIFIAPYCSKMDDRGFTKRLHVKIPGLLDYSKTLNDSLFFNCGHLNEQGAKVFTRRLLRDIQE